MKKIYRVDELPEKENIYLAKDMLGWRVVHPIKNEDGSWNWFNLLLGSWNNLIGLLFILFLLLMFYLAWNEMTVQVEECLARNLTVIQNVVNYKSSFNISALNFST